MKTSKYSSRTTLKTSVFLNCPRRAKHVTHVILLTIAQSIRKSELVSHTRRKVDGIVVTFTKVGRCFYKLFLFQDTKFCNRARKELDVLVLENNLNCAKAYCGMLI